MLSSLFSFWRLWGKSVSLPFLTSRACLHSLAHGPFFHLQSWQHSIFTSLLVRTFARTCVIQDAHLKSKLLITSVKSLLLCMVIYQQVSGMWTSVSILSITDSCFYQWLHYCNYFGAQNITDLVKLARVSL